MASEEIKRQTLSEKNKGPVWTESTRSEQDNRFLATLMHEATKEQEAYARGSVREQSWLEKIRWVSERKIRRTLRHDPFRHLLLKIDGSPVGFLRFHFSFYEEGGRTKKYLSADSLFITQSSRQSLEPLLELVVVLEQLMQKYKPDGIVGPVVNKKLRELLGKINGASSDGSVILTLDALHRIVSRLKQKRSGQD